MNSKLTRLKNVQAKIEISLTKEEMKKFEDLAISKLTKTMEIEGCRTGHLTEDTVREKGDKEQIKAETTSQAINGTLTEVVMKEKVFPISQPVVKIESENPLKFNAVFDTVPDIKLGDYKKHSLKMDKIEVSKEEIGVQIEMFKGQVAEKKEVERAVKKGDLINIDFEGFDMDGKSVPGTKSDKFDMDVGSGKMIPGFEEESIGMKKGEKKDFDITFPKEYHAPQMAGKKYKFKIKLNSISEKILPEFNEAFVEKITGRKQSTKDFEEEIRKHLVTKKEGDQFKLLEEEFLDKNLKEIDFDISETDKNGEVERMVDGAKMQGLQMGKPWEKYLEEMGKTEDGVKKEFEGMAVLNVKKRYVVQEIIRAEKLEIKDDIVEVQIKKYEEDAKKMGKDFKKEDFEKGGKQFEALRNHFLIEEMFKKFITK